MHRFHADGGGVGEVSCLEICAGSEGSTQRVARDVSDMGRGHKQLGPGVAKWPLQKQC